MRDEPIEGIQERPWAEGYRLARDFLESAKGYCLRDGWIDIDALCEHLDIARGRLPLQDGGIRAICLGGPHHRPSILINPSHIANTAEAGRRFTVAHELCHLLYDRSHGARLASASGPWAALDLEKRANAFAAMLLMPPECIREAVSVLEGAIASTRGVYEIARSLKTSFRATLEHLKNLELIEEAEHDRILSEVEEAWHIPA